jgi:hypothetical protein
MAQFPAIATFGGQRVLAEDDAVLCRFDGEHAQVEELVVQGA